MDILLQQQIAISMKLLWQEHELDDQTEEIKKAFMKYSYDVKSLYALWHRSIITGIKEKYYSL